ncbi:hypothetical protein [Cytobacillus firmus]|nr:hypothetical protein [Cytobacillus firmus]
MFAVLILMKRYYWSEITPYIAICAAESLLFYRIHFPDPDKTITLN